MNKDARTVVVALAGATALVVGMGIADGSATQEHSVAARSSRQMPLMVVQEKLHEGAEAEREREREGEGFDPGEGQVREAENETINGPSQQQYDQRAYPRAYITSARTQAAQRAYSSLPDATPLKSFKSGTKDRAARASLAQSWQSLGPKNPVVPAPVTYTGTPTTNSGRVTALMIDPDTCESDDCRVWMAAAGGGIWRTDDATAAQPEWTALDDGLTSNAFGSLAMDPQDHAVVYAGSGEPSGSSDSEAGVGLFKSTDAGDTWSLLPGLDSVSGEPVADQRSIAAILVDPTDSNTIWIGTALARHGSSSVNGGRRTPPNAPTLGIYKSTDGGDTFSLEFSVDPKTPAPATGTDYFTGGVRRLAFDPNDSGEIYASIQGYGIYRHGNALDSDPNGWNQVFASEWGQDSPQGNDPDPFGAFTDFGLASTDSGTKTRLYVGDTSDAYEVALFYRADGVNAIADTALVAAEEPLGAPWDLKSDSNMTNPQGYSSYNWCQNGQCSYDAFVKVDPTNPDVVWLGGSMAYNELIAFGEKGVSNGRSVVRSTNGGDSFTDMTNDNADPSLGMHPDQRAIVLNPQNTGQAIIGSDGGVVRTSGSFVDQSDRCDSRGLNATQLAFCKLELSSVPTKIDSLNVGLDTLQFQSVTANPTQPLTDVIGGTQDNGTWAWDGTGNSTAWFESVGGDGGQSAISPGANSRMHTYYGPSGDVNFNGNDPLGWNYVTGPIDYSGESSSFYVPMISDPMAAGTYYMGAQSLWRTQDSGGNAEQLKTQCNEFFGTGPWDQTCGDWVPVGPQLTSRSNYLVALARSSGDTQTMWMGTRYGDLYVSKNVDAAPALVSFTAVDTAETPGRFVSGIAVDPTNPNHAWISYSGYGAYTPTTPGHVFEALYDPATGTATFTNRSYDLGDLPVTGIGVDWSTGDVYASTDFGVTRLASGATAWATAADGLPPVATYGVTMDANARVLYAATHGRGAYRVALDPIARIAGPTAGEVGTPVTFSSTGSAGYGTTLLKWTLPDGSTATSNTVQYAPKVAGAQQVRLEVTDSLGHKTSASLTFTAAAKPTNALTPVFGAVNSKVGGFTAQVSNFDPAFAWTVVSNPGTATIDGNGLITVSGLGPEQAATVTVATARDGFPNGSATVSGKALGQCGLKVKAKSGNFKLPKSGTAKVVKKATAAGPGCKLAPARVRAVRLSGSGSPKVGVERLNNGAVKLTTNGPRVKVTVTYVARSSTPGATSATWSRTWRSKQ